MSGTECPSSWSAQLREETGKHIAQAERSRDAAEARRGPRSGQEQADLPPGVKGAKQGGGVSTRGRSRRGATGSACKALTEHTSHSGMCSHLLVQQIISLQVAPSQRTSQGGLGGR